MSNTLWGQYEAGQRPLSNRIQAAVAEAFGWNEDWPSDPPARITPEQTADLLTVIERLEQAVDHLTVEVQALRGGT